MAGCDTRQRYKNALEAIARGETEDPQTVAQMAIRPPAPMRRGHQIICEGDRFGRLEAIYELGLPHTKPDGTPRPRFRNDHLWLCWCDCGNFVTVRRIALCAYQTQSCGCIRRDLAIVKHLGRARKMVNFKKKLRRSVKKLKREALLRGIANAKVRRLIPYAGQEPRPDPKMRMRQSGELPRRSAVGG